MTNTICMAKNSNKPRTIYVSDDLWRQIKASCALAGVSVSEWVRQEIKKNLLVKIVFWVSLGVCTYSWFSFPPPKRELIVQTFVNFVMGNE